MSQSDLDRQSAFESRFLTALRHHLQGLRRKILNDFAQAQYERELSNLSLDPVYSVFAFNNPEYVLVRLVGRISISVGRRLGEIYDKILRFEAAARFGLQPEQVKPLLKGLELDIALRYSLLSTADVDHLVGTVQRYLSLREIGQGIGIEIRYNFNPNDSARLRKDVAMAEYVLAENLVPVYLVFSSISPRAEAIARLRRAGWNFLTGQEAIEFARDLFGLDIGLVLEKPEIKAEVQKEVSEIMSSMMTSFAFQKVLEAYVKDRPKSS